ncbi:glycoprotein B [lung-eye-trachea disease-associated herpesvirus]|uniref:Glycoprotein B n=1 Tax=lung-eye-trachea disease-associated herpesvirus TaxID=203820 RepID=Q8BAH5_9ALPH|nr:glycoprotein B [lung-eye-trachea disease-associated herpesvirus]
MRERWASWALTLFVAVVAGAAVEPPAESAMSMEELTKNITSAEAVPLPDFRICGLSTGTDLVRIAGPRKCHDYTDDRNYDEGIAVIFKEDIVPYTFPVTVYYKQLTTLTTWADPFGSKSVSHRTTARYPPQGLEVTGIDAYHHCNNEISVQTGNVILTMRHKDEERKAVPLYPSRFGSETTRSYDTVNETYIAFQWWGFKTCTTVNCRVIDTIAKSPYPYNYFATATGDTVEMSPFYSSTSTDEPMNEDPAMYSELTNYYTKNRTTGANETTPVRAFLTKPEFTVSWAQREKTKQVCSMKIWQEVENVVRVEQPARFHFTAKELTVTFTTEKTPFDIDRLLFSDCVPETGKKAIDRIYESKYADTHVRINDTSLYLAEGGFLIMFQPLLSKKVPALVQNMSASPPPAETAPRRPPRSVPVGAPESTPIPYSAAGYRSRRRRALADEAGGGQPKELIETIRSAAFLQIQFVYDKIQAYNNAMFARIVYAWCELQNREITIWEQLSKINPSAVMSSIVGHPVSAKKMGDVIAIADCLTIPRSQVRLLNSLHITEGDKAGKNLCYSRPVVTFSITENATNDGKLRGHLGENNELVPYVGLTEVCEPNSRKYFLFDGVYMIYENYNFVRTVPVTSIQALSTFVELNLTTMENLDLIALNVYSSGELRDANVNNLDELLRLGNADRQTIATLADAIHANAAMDFIKGIETMFAGLGVVGEALGKAVGTIGGALAGIVSGVVGFFANPFGGFTIILIVAGGVMAAFIAFKFVQLYKKDPMKTLFPMTSKTLKNSDPSDPDGDLEPLDDDRRREAQRLARDFYLLSAEQRLAARDLRKRNMPGFLSRFKRPNNGYERVSSGPDNELSDTSPV